MAVKKLYPSGITILIHWADQDAGDIVVLLDPYTLSPYVYKLNLPFNEVDQMAGAARTAPERSPHGLYFIQR